HFFLILTRPPPRPTLFPYTTLFRSPRAGGQRRAGAARVRGGREPAARRIHAQVGCRGRRSQRQHRASDSRRTRRRRRRQAERAEDRKSTRLNSSHLVISYAVFCLKK